MYNVETPRSILDNLLDMHKTKSVIPALKRLNTDSSMSEDARNTFSSKLAWATA